MGKSGFAHSGNVFDQQVAARQKAGQAQANLHILAQNHPVDLGGERRRYRIVLRSLCLERGHPGYLGCQLTDFRAQFQ